MMTEGDDGAGTLDPERAARLQALAADDWTRFGGRPNAGQSQLREAMSNDGERPTNYVSNYVARHTVAALPAWQQTPFRDEPITENEVQRWWANWDPALKRLGNTSQGGVGLYLKRLSRPLCSLAILAQGSPLKMEY